MKAAHLLGRILFGGFFIYSGINHLKETKAISQYAGAKNVPMPDLAVTASGALLIAGGSSILLGVKPKLGTLAIITFLAGVSPVMHDFWTSQDPEKRQSDMIHFSKNMAMLGAAMALMGTEEPWPLSVPIGRPDTLTRVRRFARKVAA
ncbi:MAG: DoxX family protein [Candidatus Korobacteraceae bacterium]